jgi:hypothetical protein
MNVPPAEVRGIPLLLFLADDNPSSLTAYGNIQVALETFGADAFALEIIDLAKRPDQAIVYSVFVTPTLLAPSSSRRLIGDLEKWPQVQMFLRSLIRS